MKTKIFLLAILFTSLSFAQTKADSTNFKKYTQIQQLLKQEFQNIEKQEFEYLGRIKKQKDILEAQFNTIASLLEEEKQKLKANKE